MKFPAMGFLGTFSSSFCINILGILFYKKNQPVANSLNVLHVIPPNCPGITSGRRKGLPPNVNR